MARVLAALFAILIAAPAFGEDAAAPPPVGQVDAALAPVALYPDALLIPLLMAATYPDEIAEADGWLGEAHNAALRGDALVTALEPRPWAPSVKALVPFPVTLDMLATRPAWMARLGRAFIAEPQTVLTEIQKLRHQAIATGKLKSSPRLAVHDEGGIVTIASGDPAMVYVPIYNPALIYGAWAYPNFPPMFVEPPRGADVSGADIESGIGFSVGYGILAPLWGWAHPGWTAGTVEIDTASYNRINRYGPHVSGATWRHEPHGTGYFHITQDQVTPVAPPRKHERAAAKPKHGAHDARHAKSREHVKAKTAHAAHGGKVHVAANRRREHRER